ncbi:MAG: hypothetical protein KDC44_20750, partial [Phaeodactylibacter sp.]|nr:hypothetical protein [Phaeodactylibacter sp.]
MKLHLFSLLTLCLLAFTHLQAQTVIFDFEAPETTTAFTYFGSSLDGQAAAVITNPNPTGLNTSDNVVEYIKAGDAQTWAGSYANPAPASPIDATSGGQICVDVHFDHIGNVTVKLEQSSTDGEDWLTTQENTTTGEWETLCFDLSAPSVEGSMAPATGHIYGQIVLFFDFNQAGTGSDVITYFNNVVQHPGESCTTVYDFEAPETTTAFTYFGSSLDGQAAAVIANPNPTSVNMSGNVAEYIKAGDAQSWAGCYANPAPTAPIDATSGGQICVDVHFDHIGNVALKLEQSTTGGEDWITQLENTTTGEWETICFDLDTPSLEGSMAAATGHIYAQMVLFFDFNQAGTGSDVITYFDNIEFCGAGGQIFRDVEFAVDMNEYAGGFSNVAVAGDFNGWNGTSNIMEDLDGDGVYTTVITLATGTYEYKFVLDG